MERWQQLLIRSVVRARDLASRWGLNETTMEAVAREYPIRINPYFLGLIQDREDPIYRQVVPDPQELQDAGVEDPLNEEGARPVPSIVHRYPDRCLLLVTHQCPIYCRFCTRKRFVGKVPISRAAVREGIAYIRARSEIRDVILSGGDPLMLKDRELEEILQALRDIPHVEILRIGTRVPGALPQRITRRLCRILKKYHPLYMNLHFIHPRELTPEVARACRRLADAGIPLGAQIVLLRGINDDPQVMRELVRGLLAIRVKPYYLYQADLVRGAEHFRTPVEAGLEIIRGLRGHVSGMAVPHFVIDAPGGGGKIPLIPPEYVLEHNEREVLLQNYQGNLYRYPQVQLPGCGTEPETPSVEEAQIP